MDIDPDYQPEFGSLKNLLLDMAEERSWETLLNMTGNRLLERPHMVLGRIWIVLPGDICATCPMRQECPDQTECLHLVASKGHPLTKTGEPTETLDDHYRRVPLGVRKVGRIAALSKDIAIEDMVKECHREPNREWAIEQGIQGVRGFPLKYKDKVLGVSMQFTRIKLAMPGEGQVWGRIIADHLGAALANARAFDELKKVTAEKERIESELKFAKLVQEGFLPLTPPAIPNYDFAAEMTPAKFVGGDFYDFIPLKNNRLGIVVGDVSGKGVSAALYMARLLSDFRYISQNDPTPEKLLQQVNDIACERSLRGMFATAIFLLLDRTTNKLTISSAGHHPALLQSPGKDIESVGLSSGIPLGILPGQSYSSEEIQLQTGNQVLLYTDGATEPFNENKESFGLERMIQVMQQSSQSPRKLIIEIKQSIENFTRKATLHDDLTLLTFRVH
ncbi:Transcriptional regulator, Fis family [hydrothermal vent metagenome]|uniref:Transcriptional regulator, Fis family n=1 Tax=hydrothermal vent metagenome TaxID=652676 RepID=A0A3B1CEU9_9ZZZZ